ncbi:hypothetical protein [Aureibacter tunicatorum]|uniref:Uncharacterized protein n=1 Tax=Aureibacter tunicatorum TaxID=866807 RepID=A0AAE3XQW4_9BACT|nr:hypothetical protein [Aureibacter tunicatorum]MDR6241010.1 hypothetical protein [Aureibacter tunicatorum]BDD03788.1 hypothetical protein AUTU_12710 [Aureibacter tunicatorum]
MKIFGRFFLFFFLTIVTQIGGVAYLFSILIRRVWGKPIVWWQKAVTFMLVYLLFTFLIVPWIAPVFGRVKISNANGVSPVNYMTVVLNRNYVVEKLNEELQMLGENLEEESIKVKYLDANFPFADGFPLLPHLSHNDGRKIDLALVYETPLGQISSDQKSISGYGVFEMPIDGEFDQPERCMEQGYLQYDYPKYMTFGRVNNDLVFSEKGTKRLLVEILKLPSIEKVFVEPHLKQRLNITNPKIRFHGCRAVRHDDHIHMQLI